MTAANEGEVLDALSGNTHMEKYKSWGLRDLRDQGPAVLLHGDPGTGKTSIAIWMADRIKKGLKILDVATIGGGDPGESERKVDALFADAKARRNMTVLLDECNVLLQDRSQIKGEGMTWMLGSTQAIMTNLNTYKGLVIATTNHIDKLDPALSDRFMAIIKIERPDASIRNKIWKVKWPSRFPLQMTEGTFKAISEFDLSGRQIETVILRLGMNCLRKGIKPTMKLLEHFALEETLKKLQ